MAVQNNTLQLTRAQAQTWIEDHGIERLPASGERMEYIPPGRYDQFNLARTDNGYTLTSHVLA